MSVSRILSLIVLGLYLIGLFFYCQDKSSEENIDIVIFFLIFNGLIMSLIWFPDEIGNRVGGRITRTSPGCILTFMGWVMFVVPGLIVIINKIFPDFFPKFFPYFFLK